MNNVTVNMENLSDPEREQLLALMEKGNKAKWAGPSGNWSIGGDGSIWCASLRVGEYHNTGFCGKTRKQAEFISDQLTNYAWMLHAWLEVAGDWRPNWASSSYKYYAEKTVDGKIGVGSVFSFRDPHLFYFDTVEQCKQWIELVGDKFKAQTEVK